MKKNLANLISTVAAAAVISFCTTLFIGSGDKLSAGSYNSAAISSSIGKVDNIIDLQNEIVNISESAKKSVAFIKTTKTMKGQYGNDPLYDFLRQFGYNGKIPPQFNPKREGLGTGFVIDDKEGLVVTNNHVIDGADKIEITINSKKFNAKLIGTDPKTDIGLIKLENFSSSDIKALPFSDSEKIKVGSFAIAIGNPFGLSHTVTFGIISATGRSDLNVTEYENFIQTDAAINPGNSGGPLLNVQGEVLGMNTAILSRSGGYMGIGLAVPANMIKSVVAQLKTGGKVVRAQMGVVIQPLTDELKKQFGIKNDKAGILVSSVAEKSPAELGGIKAGDVIIEFNSKSVESVPQLRNVVAFTDLGKKIPVKIVRDGKEIIVSVILNNTDYSIGEDAYFSEDFGFSVKMENKKVVVDKIEQESLAATSGLIEGDIIKGLNKKRIQNINEFKQVMKNTNALLLLIERKGREFFIVINK